jgi:hypothetical protein
MSQTSHNLFNFGKRGKFITDKPNHILPHSLIQIGEEPHDEQLQEHVALVGYINSATNGNEGRFKHHYSETDPLPLIYPAGRRPNNDIQYDYVQQFPDAEVKDFPTNHDLDFNWLNVYPDGTPIAYTPSDYGAVEAKERLKVNEEITGILDGLKSSVGDNSAFNRWVNKSIEAQVILTGSYPDVARQLGEITRQYQSQQAMIIRSREITRARDRPRNEQEGYINSASERTRTPPVQEEARQAELEELRRQTPVQLARQALARQAFIDVLVNDQETDIDPESAARVFADLADAREGINRAQERARRILNHYKEFNVFPQRMAIQRN